MPFVNRKVDRIFAETWQFELLNVQHQRRCSGWIFSGKPYLCRRINTGHHGRTIRIDKGYSQPFSTFLNSLKSQLYREGTLRVYDGRFSSHQTIKGSKYIELTPCIGGGSIAESEDFNFHQFDRCALCVVHLICGMIWSTRSEILTRC